MNINKIIRWLEEEYGSGIVFAFMDLIEEYEKEGEELVDERENLENLGTKR